MDTIKYVQVFSLIVLILVISLTSSFKEGYQGNVSIEKGLGLPLSALNTITFRANTSYSEIGKDEIEKLASSSVGAVFWGRLGKPVNKLNVDNEQLLTKISKHLLDTINKQIKDNEQPFSIINDEIMSIYDSTTNEYVISSKHILYRDGKMYGFVVNVQSIWNNPNLDLQGFSEVKPTGIIMQDSIVMLQNKDQSNYREYGDSLSFIQSEAIMEDKSYENEVSQKQAYGLLQDRGISSKSFTSN